MHKKQWFKKIARERHHYYDRHRRHQGEILSRDCPMFRFAIG